MQSAEPPEVSVAEAYQPRRRHSSRLFTFGEHPLEVFMSEPSKKLCIVSTIDPPHPNDRFRSMVSAITESPPGPLQYDERDAWFVQDWREGCQGDDGLAPETDCHSAIDEHLTNTYRDDLLDTVFQEKRRVGHIRLLPCLTPYVDSLRESHNARLEIPGSELSRVKMETMEECTTIARDTVEQYSRKAPVVR
jgi:hypothetical protein